MLVLIHFFIRAFACLIFSSGEVDIKLSRRNISGLISSVCYSAIIVNYLVTYSILSPALINYGIPVIPFHFVKRMFHIESEFVAHGIVVSKR